jgi:hypothetical protein
MHAFSAADARFAVRFEAFSETVASLPPPKSDVDKAPEQGVLLLF